MHEIPSQYKDSIHDFVEQIKKSVPNMDTFQLVFRMTNEDRLNQEYIGPFELLDKIKEFIETNLSMKEQKEYVQFVDEPNAVPLAIAVGYVVLKRTITYMGRLK